MKLILLTNIMSPYRKFFYDKLHAAFAENGDVFHVVLMAQTESDRHWNYHDYQTDYTIMLKGKSHRIGGAEIHINKGLKELYRKLSPDIVICAGSYLYPAVWQSLRLKKKLGFKALFWSETHLAGAVRHGAFVQRFRETLRRHILQKFDGFWYAGKRSKEFLQHYCNRDIPYILVPNLVDNSKFHAFHRNAETRMAFCHKHKLDPGKKIIILPARLSPVKGICEFLNLFHSVPQRDNATIFILGDGSLAGDITALSEQLGLDVRLMGYRPEEEMLEYYSAADIFLLPSLEDPNPLSCIEACWCGLPLLISDYVGNHPELVKHKENGGVFSYENEQDAACIVAELLGQSPDWYDSAGKLSQELVQKLYEPDQQVSRIAQETRSLLHGMLPAKPAGGRKKGAYLTIEQLNSTSMPGVAKKIESQLTCLQSHFDIRLDSRNDWNRSLLSKLRRALPHTEITVKWAYRGEYNDLDFLYVRYCFADRYLCRFFANIKKANPAIKLILEVPTYPYDTEMLGFKRIPIIYKDRRYRKRLHQYVDRIVTFAQEGKIFNIPTICTINGIDVQAVTPCALKGYTPDIHLMLIGYIDTNQGYDRIVAGLVNYHKVMPKRNIFLHIVGEGIDVPRYKELAAANQIESQLIFYGKQFGADLDAIYNKCNMGVSTLGFHRRGIEISSSLKSREFLAKGLPLITSGKTDILSPDIFPYYLEFPADDSPLDMQAIIDFYDKVYLHSGKEPDAIGREIRNFALQSCDISVAMEPVVSYINR